MLTPKSVWLFRLTCSRCVLTPSTIELMFPEDWALIRVFVPDQVATAPHAVSGWRMMTPALYQT